MLAFVFQTEKDGAMVAFAHERRELRGGDVVVVECDHQCNVRLVDDDNFKLFQNGQEHRYYGGFYRMFPARIVVPNSGYWNIVIDLGGRRTTATYRVQYIESRDHAVA
jgi:hypothetical protein